MSQKHAAKASDSEVSGIAAAVVTGAVQAQQARTDAAAEHAYWREHFHKLPSVPATATYEQYAPAFDYGWESRGGCCAKPPAERPSFESAEQELRSKWQERPAAADLSWDLARDAVRAAWERVGQAIGSEEPKPNAR